jgi:hypothetical protein
VYCSWCEKFYQAVAALAVGFKKPTLQRKQSLRPRGGPSEIGFTDRRSLPAAGIYAHPVQPRDIPPDVHYRT